MNEILSVWYTRRTDMRNKMATVIVINAINFPTAFNAFGICTVFSLFLAVFWAGHAMAQLLRHALNHRLIKIYYLQIGAQFLFLSLSLFICVCWFLRHLLQFVVIRFVLPTLDLNSNITSLMQSNGYVPFKCAPMSFEKWHAILSASVIFMPNKRSNETSKTNEIELRCERKKR